MFFEKKPSELVGLHVAAVIKDPSESEAFLAQAEERPALGCYIVRELTLTDSANMQHSFSVVNIPSGYNTDVSSVFISVAYDITVRQNDEPIRLKLMDNIVSYNRHLAQLSSIVSHNLRAPVANVKTQTEDGRDDCN